MRIRSCFTVGLLRSISGSLLISFILVGIWSSQAFGATEVILRENPSDESSADVFLKDSKTRKETKFLTVNDVHPGCYRVDAEYHDGWLYIVRRPGTTAETAGRWELWRYRKDGHGEMVFDGGHHFRLREDGEMIAVLRDPLPGHEGRLRAPSLHLIEPDGTPVKEVSPDSLIPVTREYYYLDFLELEGWTGNSLWFRGLAKGGQITYFFRIDTPAMTTQTYDMAHLNVCDVDYALNTELLLVAYSDYPVMFDTCTYNEFVRTGAPVLLYVYNLETKERKKIATNIATAFDPRWGADSKLAYTRGAFGHALWVLLVLIVFISLTIFVFARLYRSRRRKQLARESISDG